MIQKIQKLLPLFLLQVLFGGICLFLIRHVPYDGSSDEAKHYYFNVRFILDHHRLPVSGQDDLEAYHTLVRSEARISTICSYVIYPALPYGMSVAFAYMTHHMFGWPRL